MTNLCSLAVSRAKQMQKCNLCMCSHFQNLSFSFIFHSTAAKVKERHELLLVALKHVFKQEEEAYNLVSQLSWILPVVVICAGLIDLLFIYVYMKYAHQWKDIISKSKIR